VYWFLGILFLLFLGVGQIYVSSDQFKKLEKKIRKPSWTALGILLIAMTMGFFFMNLIVPVDTWLPIGFLFVVQPLRVPLYLGYFGLGIYAYLNDWFSEDGYKPDPEKWVAAFIISGLIYLVYRFQILPGSQTTIFLKAGNAILFNLFCFSSLMTALGLFQAKLNYSSTVWRSQARNSYGIYYLHPIILYPLALIFVNTPLPIFLKAISIIILTILISWGLSNLILRRVPFLRAAF
jgi:hypothetical protein